MQDQVAQKPAQALNVFHISCHRVVHSLRFILQGYLNT